MDAPGTGSFKAGIDAAAPEFALSISFENASSSSMSSASLLCGCAIVLDEFRAFIIGFATTVGLRFIG